MKHHTHHIVVSDLYPGDAIGNFVLAVHDMLIQRKIPVAVYAERYAETLATKILPYKAFFETVQPEDTLFYQLSNHDPALQRLLSVSCHKIIYYHNITPGHYFSPYSRETAQLLDAGRAALPLVRAADAILANSQYSLSELSDFVKDGTPLVFFPPFLPSQVKKITSLSVCDRSPLFEFPYLLVLGRVVPHKRIEDAIRIFSLLHQKNTDWHLVIAGSLYTPYADKLRELISRDTLLSEYIVFTDKIKQSTLIRLLHNAIALLQTSGHEGFCMPLFEAMLAQVPVFANKQAAMQETLGGSGFIIDSSNAYASAMQIMNILNNCKLNHVTSMQNERARKLIDFANEEVLLKVLFQH